jgi:hypothetical protein
LEFLTISEILLLTVDEYTRLSDYYIFIPSTFIKASNSPISFSFTDLCILLEYYDEDLIQDCLLLSNYVIDRTSFNAQEIVGYLLMKDNAVSVFPELLLFQDFINIDNSSENIDDIVSIFCG